MKTIFTTLLCAAFFVASSQPTLTSANEAIPGVSFSYIFVDSTGILPGPSGANQVWDFSNALPIGVISDQSWVDPTSTPYVADFPNSDICQVVYAGVNPIYNYHSRNSSNTQLNGIAFSAGLTPNVMVYTDPEVIRNYPASINFTNSDSYAGISTMIVGPLTTITYRNGIYQYEVDGYGTLITPVDNYPNTLRMKLRQVFTDSTVYTGTPLAQVTYHFSTSYFWASTDAGDRLYQFYIGYDTLVTSSGTSFTKSVSYLGSATGIQQPVQEDFSLSINPNPASGITDLVVTAIKDQISCVELYDLSGRLVQTRNFNLVSGVNKIQFDVSEIDSGVYLVRLTQSGYTQDTAQLSVLH